MSEPRQTSFPAPALEVGDRVEIIKRGFRPALQSLGFGRIESISDDRYTVEGKQYYKRELIPMPTLEEIWSQAAAIRKRNLEQMRRAELAPGERRRYK